jgi:acyl-CoA synthetase (AMP-forming)/AMP-acid ligase II
MFFDQLTIGAVLRATAKAKSDHVAIKQGDLQLTYRELDESVDKLAAYLLETGLKKGDRVAYIFLNQWEILASYYAIARIGAVVVSLNYRLMPEEIEFQLKKTTARALLYDASFGPVLSQLPNSLIKGLHLISSGDGVDGPLPESTFTTIMEMPSRGEVTTIVQASDDSGIWFTSGTTGKSKGAIVRHASSLASAEVTSLSCKIGADCRFLATAPLFHRGAMEDMHLAVTLVGGTHIMLPKFDARKALELIESERVTHAFIVPTMSRLMLQDPECARFDLRSMQRWISASAPFPPELAMALRERLCLREDVVMDAYGITESLLNTVCEPKEMASHPGSVGRPVSKMRIRIVDEDLQWLPQGQVGEIVTSGPTTFRSYLDDDEAFKAAVFEAEGVPWYRTGDLGYCDADGFFYIVDRKKDMVISGGENVYCAEVENAIARHCKVAEVAVVGLPDEMWGERVVAVVVPRKDEIPTVEDIIGSCGNLAPYKRPREVRFVASLPRNSFGKVQKPELRKLGASVIKAGKP